MAVYAKVDSNRPIENGLAVGRAPQAKATQAPDYQDSRAEKLSNMDAFAAIINARYKVGGATSWERPGSDL